ncbi:MAG: DUF98 domain-containing protein [Methanophagales archaeon ANME-1-THS]|nr:MAG: DUF98 domain-containing protein [Methanophagales archaeon ANME-1-THS]
MVHVSLLNSVQELEKKYRLTANQRALLISDGSTTTLLEAFTGQTVLVKGRSQSIVRADARLASELQVEPKSEVSKRIVHLVSGGSSEILAYAISYTPIERLSPALLHDVQRTDIPIGKILKMHKIESRREIKEIGFIRDTHFKEIFGSECGMYRTYLIIHQNAPLMKIEEYFPLRSDEHYESSVGHRSRDE